MKKYDTEFVTKVFKAEGCSMKLVSDHARIARTTYCCFICPLRDHNLVTSLCRNSYEKALSYMQAHAEDFVEALLED